MEVVGTWNILDNVGKKHVYIWNVKRFDFYWQFHNYDHQSSLTYFRPNFQILAKIL